MHRGLWRLVVQGPHFCCLFGGCWESSTPAACCRRIWSSEPGEPGGPPSPSMASPFHGISVFTHRCPMFALSITARWNSRANASCRLHSCPCAGTSRDPETPRDGGSVCRLPPKGTSGPAGTARKWPCLDRILHPVLRGGWAWNPDVIYFIVLIWRRKEISWLLSPTGL